MLAVFLAVVVAPLLLIALLEAASSFLLLVVALRRGDQQLELKGRRHAQYDAELGWVNAPGGTVPNMYGPGVDVHIDSRGFRQNGPPSARTGAGTLRVVCSGDSFTLGVGVADDRTWCARLAAMDSGLATVNMGQTGYGVDQMYLWYKRDGAKLEHDVQILAYITNDFRRMQLGSAYGFAKPVLALQKDSLVVENTPVPRSDSRARWYWTAVVVRNELRLVQALLWARDSVFHGHGVQRGTLSAEWTADDSLTWINVLHITHDLARINRAKGSRLILVHLPVIEDYWSQASDPWRTRARAAAAGGDFTFVDLVEPLRRLPADSLEQMFIGQHVPGYADGFGHYTPRGNEWVAGEIDRRLRGMPVAVAGLAGRR